MTSTARTRLGLLAAAIALPVLLACGAGSTGTDTDQQPGDNGPAQVEQQVPEEPAAEVPEVDVPEVAEEPAAEEVYYKNCTEVREAGKAPIREGDPGYSSKLDRDGDGVACEQ